MGKEIVNNLIELLTIYPEERNTRYPGRRKSQEICTRILPALLKDLNSTLKQQGSIGRGNWADVPWVASMNTNITSSVSNGVYIVFLFHSEGEGVYLTLNQGTGGANRRMVDTDKHREIRESLIDVIDTGKIGLVKGQLEYNSLMPVSKIRAMAYEAACIMWKYYSRDDLSDMRDDSDIVSVYNYLVKNYLKVEDIILRHTEREDGQVGQIAIKPVEEFDHINEVNYYWLYANPNRWNPSDTKLGEKKTYTTHNRKGNKRHIYKHMASINPGDIIIGYVSSPQKQITTVFETTKGLHNTEEGEVFEFKKVKELENPISLELVRDHPELGNSEPIINSQGSLFKLTENEYEALLDLIEEQNPIKDRVGMRPYTIDDATKELFIDKDDFIGFLYLLNSKMNVILQGPPGVGKTFLAKRLAFALVGYEDNEKVHVIQFHQSYAYEDFIQGYRPNPDSDGGFHLTTGIFYDLCQKARNNPESKYVLIIDEINRGNLSKIFGELMMLIEHDKRGDEYALSLTYSRGERFSVPRNLYLVGTMNTADRSIALVDYALRRRFSFVTLVPQYNSNRFKSFLQKNGISEHMCSRIVNNFISLNEKISADTNNLGEGYQIGHSYFCVNQDQEKDEKWYNEIIKYDIEPLLKEYWFDDSESVKDIISGILI